MVFSLYSCVETSGSAWMRQPLTPDDEPSSVMVEPRYRGSGTRKDTRTHTLGAMGTRQAEGEGNPPPTVDVAARLLGVFRNTYYSFPNEAEYSGSKTKIFDASCKLIAEVPTTFHDMLCVQGSGRLASARTVSFAKRNCDCAAVCPRSGQKICYEALDPAKYPYGRGALGKAITPFRTIAVDDKVIALGTAVFIPAYVSQPMPDGSVHDGCFRAEDRGLKVVGHSVDVFTGGEADTKAWNQLVPTGQGVEVYVDHPRCKARWPDG
jgi:3D (Asp-Asp-Asp) domain-containing protein